MTSKEDIFPTVGRSWSMPLALLNPVHFHPSCTVEATTKHLHVFTELKYCLITCMCFHQHRHSLVGTGNWKAQFFLETIRNGHTPYDKR